MLLLVVNCQNATLVECKVNDPNVHGGLQINVSFLLNYSTCSRNYLCPIAYSCLTLSELETRRVPFASPNQAFFDEDFSPREAGVELK